MNKSDVRKLINLTEMYKLAKDNDVTKYINNLAKCWQVLRTIEYRINEKIDGIRSKYHFCNKCKNAIKKSTVKYLYKTEIQRTLVYSDSGYGEDDRYADCEFTIKYIKCPKCGNEITIDNIKGNIVPGTEHDKYGTIYN